MSDIAASSLNLHPHGEELMVSPRYRNRLNFQSIEADSVVRNLATNRQSTYGVNWALKQYEDPRENHQQALMLSPRASNHLSELEKLIDVNVSRQKVANIVAAKNLDSVSADVNQCEGVCGIELDQAEQWRQEQGPVPDAMRSLPDSIKLVNDIERWLMEQEKSGDVVALYEPSSSQDVQNQQPQDVMYQQLQDVKHQQLPDVRQRLLCAAEHNENRSQATQTRPIASAGARRHPLKDVLVPGYCHRLLQSPLLYTPAGFGPFASQTITLPRPRPRSQQQLQQATRAAAAHQQSLPRPTSDLFHSDYVVVYHRHRRRRRRKKHQSHDAGDIVTEMNMALHNQWNTLSLSRLSSSRKSLTSSRKGLVATLAESQGGSELRPKARIQHGRLEFVIPENLNVEGKAPTQSELVSKLTALQRYRLKIQHRKKLREDSENFVDELEKQLDKREIRARFLNPVQEPKFRQRFMLHSQSTIMKSLNGEAQRFLYSESKNKLRHVQIEQRQPHREMHHALQRIDQVRARHQRHVAMLEQQYLLNLREFNAADALSATRARLHQYQKQAQRVHSGTQKRRSPPTRNIPS